VPLLNFGQPFDGIIQMAYVVPDLHKAMREWTERLRIGPWFLFSPFQPVTQSYRGQPTDVSVSIGMAYSGHMQFELIEQHNDAPSVYRDGVEKRGYGFHHWGVSAMDFPRSLAEFQTKGYEAVYTLKPDPTTRLAYIDTTADLPGYVELIETGPATEGLFTMMYQAALGWDGKDPIREMALPA
jgi:Glyoxalase/Bleomycin resistance protein/Dioxygenase superfamily